MYYGGVTIQMKVASKLKIVLEISARVYSLCSLSIYHFTQIRPFESVFHCANSIVNKEEESFIDEFPFLFWYSHKGKHVMAW